ncbi:hypothetical protein F4777DRAFT_574552 [Nemania sp. FL0916]|nr:hypothetical protein F4777DRAFT_574552 [Nemania sp. FL0916]
MPYAVRMGDAEIWIKKWLDDNGGKANSASGGCFCGLYQIGYDDDKCHSQSHYAYRYKHHCGRKSGGALWRGKTRICPYADSNAIRTIDKYVVEGLCPKCKHSPEERKADLVSQQLRRRNPEWVRRGEQARAEVERREQDREKTARKQREWEESMKRDHKVRLEEEQVALLRESKENQEARRKEAKNNKRC